MQLAELLRAEFESHSVDTEGTLRALHQVVSTGTRRRRRRNVASVTIVVIVVTALSIGVPALIIAWRSQSAGFIRPSPLPPPVPSTHHWGSFAGGDNGQPQIPVDDASRTLQAFFDARVEGSGAEAWLGAGVRVGAATGAFGVGLYTLREVHPPLHVCGFPGENPCPTSPVMTRRFLRYLVSSRKPASAHPSVPIEFVAPTIVESCFPGYPAGPGRYTYRVLVSGYFPEDQPNITLYDVVGPGVNGYGQHLPAVVLAETTEYVCRFTPPRPQLTPPHKGVAVGWLFLGLGLAVILAVQVLGFRIGYRKTFRSTAKQAPLIIVAGGGVLLGFMIRQVRTRKSSKPLSGV
jgi:hypothetical protein